MHGSCTCSLDEYTLVLVNEKWRTLSHGHGQTQNIDSVLSEHVHAEKAAALLYGHAYIRISEMQSLDYMLCVIIVQLLQLNPSFPASCLSGVGLIAQAHGGNG